VLVFGLLLLNAFDVSGRLVPPAKAAVTLHGALSPFTASTLADASGRFQFSRIDAGSYTAYVFVPGRGEMQTTVVIGPSTADAKGRVQLEIAVDDSKLMPDKTNLVSARQLAIPDRAKRAYMDAQKKLTKRDVDAALADLKRAVDIAPRFAEAWNNLGTVSYQTQNYTAAEEYFRRALLEDPDSYAPLVNLGGVLINLGKLDEAWKYNVYAVLKRPGDALANAQLGMTYMQLRKLELAEKYLKEARRIDPAHFSHPQIHLAAIYAATDRKPLAAEQLEEFLRYHPDAPSAGTIRATIDKLR
jgi:tetratricopeptide (TPR) repeat protein